MARIKGLHATLATRQTMRLDGAGELVLACSRGSVWVTHGPTCDVVASRGDRLRIAASGPVLLQGLDDAEIELRWADQTGMALRTLLAWVRRRLASKRPGQQARGMRPPEAHTGECQGAIGSRF